MLPRLASVEENLRDDAQKLGQDLLIQSNLLKLLISQQNAELGNDPLVIGKRRFSLKRAYQNHDNSREKLIFQIQLYTTVFAELLDHLQHFPDQDLAHFHVNLDPFHSLYYRVQYLSYHPHDKSVWTLYFCDLVLEEVYRKAVLVDYALILRL